MSPVYRDSAGRFARADAANVVLYLARQQVQQTAVATAGTVLTAVGNIMAEYVAKMIAAAGHADDPAYRQTMLTKLGRLGQLAMLDSYKKIVEGEESAADRTHYRAGKGRLAGGVLLAALEREDFFSVNAGVLLWGDWRVLSGAARHWHRIAFGAAGAGKGIDRRFDVTVGDMFHAVLGVSGGPSAGFSMPPGMWFGLGGPGSGEVQGSGARGTGLFYPKAGSTLAARHVTFASGETQTLKLGKGPRSTKGIRTHDFFSPGVEAMAKALPDLIDAYTMDVFGRVVHSIDGIHHKVARLPSRRQPVPRVGAVV